MGGRFKFRDDRDLFLDLIEFFQGKGNLGDGGNGHDVEGKVAGTARCRRVEDTVFKGFFGKESAGCDFFPRESDNPFSHITGLFYLLGDAKGHCRRPKGGKTNSFRKDGHGICRAVHGAGTAGCTDILAETGESRFIDFPGPVGSN